MQVLMEKMKYDPYSDNTSTSYKPLQLLALIEKTVLAKNENQYPFTTVYEQEFSIYSFSQSTLSNEQWYERLNTKIGVGSAIGVTRQHQVLLSHVTEESNNKFEDMNLEGKKETRKDAEEHYLSYIFLRKSGKQHNKLKTDLQNDSTKGKYQYPKTH